MPDGSFDYESIRAAINERTRLVTIQKSKGYEPRPTLSVKQISELVSFIKSVKPDVICMVDNCYGEFIEKLSLYRQVPTFALVHLLKIQVAGLPQ